MKKFLSSILIIFMAVSLALPMGAGADSLSSIPEFPEAPSVSAPAIILMEPKSGTVIYEKNADAAYYPASITKIMTALVVLENCSLDEIVTFSYNATHNLEEGSSSIARTEGEQMSVKDCLYAMLVASANEVAGALAEHVSGSFSAFAQQMNAKAKSLGCTNTNFCNPSGLNDPNHYTCCRDMALIMSAAIQNETFVKIASTPTCVIPATNKHSQAISVTMKHDLLKGATKYAPAICGKTGFTSAAGFTLVTYAAKNDMDLVCVAMNCPSSTSRAESTRELFEYAFNNYTVHKINEADKSAFASNPNEFLNQNFLSLSIPEGSRLLLPNNVSFDDLNSEIAWRASADESGVVGDVIYYYNSSKVGSVPLIADNTNDQFAFLAENTKDENGNDLTTSAKSKETTKIFILVASLIAVLLVVLLVVAYKFINGKSPKHKRRKTSFSKNLK